MFYVVISYWAIFALYLLSIPNIYLAGLLPGLAIIASNNTEEGKEPGVMARALYRLSVLGFIPLFCWVFSFAVSAVLLTESHLVRKSYLTLYLVCIGLSAAGSVAALRFFPRVLEQLKHKATAGSALERNKRTDVREIGQFLPKAVDFDPLQFMDEKQGIFLGLDEQKKPVYISMGGANNAPHVQVIGTTGAGKGVSFGVMASQFLARGEAVFFCDPKNDEWAPHVLYATAQRLGVPFHFINLNAPNGPQFNMFEGCTKEEAFELFIGAFSLTEKGSSADFYGIADRRVAASAAAALAKGGTAASLYDDQGEVFGKEAEKFAGKLRELAATPSINASAGGVDFAKIVEGGGIVYIVGSMRNDIIKTVQRMLLIRFIQLAERRDRMAGPLRPVCIILDEVKYHISRPALEGLGAARDKGVHLVLAHQSLGDLEDCPADINPKAVVDAVVENCRIKICYKVQSPTTAKWLAEMSGKVLVDDESRTVQKNLALAETMQDKRSVRQAERFYIDENMLQNLAPSTCIMYGQGLPKALTIKPMKTQKQREAVTVKEVSGGAIAQGADALALDAPEAPQSLPVAPEVIETYPEPTPDFEELTPDYDDPVEQPQRGPLDLD